MPNPKKTKKDNEKQKSIDSFFSTPVRPQKKPKKLSPKYDKEKELSQENEMKIKEIEQKTQDLESTKTVPQKDTKKKSKKIPKQLFFEGNEKPFGLKEIDNKLDQIKRENVTSKYLRYLINNNQIVKDLNRGLLLDVDYDGVQNKAYCKFYDLDHNDIKIWIDTTNHEPYCLSKESKSNLESNISLTNFQGFERCEEVEIMDLLRDKKIRATKIIGKTPLDIGGSGENFKNILEGEAWEADIRYHHNYIFDRSLKPGLIYSIKNGSIKKIDDVENQETIDNMSKELIGLFNNEKKEILEFAKENLDVFLTPIPEVKRVAMDIEVNMGVHDYKIPDPQQAKQEIISVSFVSNEGLKLVYVLEREGFTYGGLHEKFPDDGKIIFFKEEKDLITEVFRLMWEFPILITFNGDNFDLNYMFHRANRLKIEKDLNPIQVKRGFGMMSRAECELRKGIHIDIFNFFVNRSISGYAFGGAYERNSLNAISSALLGREKYQHEEEIHEMDYGVLSWYNLKDSILTLELTQFNNSLAWNLIIILCRITKMPIHDLLRHQISAWVRSILFYEHRQKGFIIPRRSELQELKQGGYSKSTIDGKSFKGAYVIPPEPGIHYDVVVMDFACFSEDTEILTNKGWYSYTSIKENLNTQIKVATVNSENNNFEYHEIKKVYDYDYDNMMINFKHQGVDILVTPNHRMVYNKRTIERDKTIFENKISIKPSNELMYDYTYSIPYTGIWKGKSRMIQIGNKMYQPSDFLPFYGWFITDGGISGRSVNIYQSKEHNFRHIRSSLDKLGLQYKEYERNRPNKRPEMIFSIHNVEFRDALKRWIKDGIGKYERSRIHPDIFDLEREELLILFDSMILGDGGWIENICYIFDNTSEDLANDFQRLCLKIGYGCNIKKKNVKTRFLNKVYTGISYRCKISYERKNIIRKHHCRMKKYQGKVWCVSVNNGTVIARRNGKPFVSGNSLYPTIIKENNLSYETVSCPHEDCMDNLVKGIPYHVCTHKMGIFAYIVGFFRDIRVKYFKPKSSDKSLSAERRSYYNTIQQALKVFINSAYGVFGSQNFPLFCLPVAESTTGIGRYSIKQTIKKSESMGIKVLYGDSDSVFLLNPSKKKLEELSEWSKKELDLDLEEEKTYQFLALSERKKNYVGIYKDTKFVDIKGLVAKKKNTPEFIKKIFNEFLEILKEITNDEEFKKARSKIIDLIRTNRSRIGKTNTFTLEDYAINISLQKNLDKYVKVVPQHVSAARELKALTGRELQKGETVTFIKSKGKNGAKAIELAKLQDIDPTKYRELLKSALEQVLDALGISYDEIKGLKKMDAFLKP